jgi:hypothetical protein
VPAWVVFSQGFLFIVFNMFDNDAVLVASLFGNDVLKNTGKNQLTRNKIRESKKL